MYVCAPSTPEYIFLSNTPSIMYIQYGVLRTYYWSMITLVRGIHSRCGAPVYVHNWSILCLATYEPASPVYVKSRVQRAHSKRV